jgi:hypothetical protein
MGERREVEQREVEGLRKEVFPFGPRLFPALAEEILHIHDHDLSQPTPVVKTIIILAFLSTSFFRRFSSVSQYMPVWSKTDSVSGSIASPYKWRPPQFSRRHPRTSDELLLLLRLRVMISLSLLSFDASSVGMLNGYLKSYNLEVASLAV